MQRQCCWNQEEEQFAPVLRRMIPILDEECRQAEERYLDAKRRRDAVQEMFAEEIRMERRKKIHVTNVRIIVMLYASDFAISR